MLYLILAVLIVITLFYFYKPPPVVVNGMTFCDVSQLPEGVYEVLFEVSRNMYVVASTTNPGTTQDLYFLHKCKLPKDSTGNPQEYFIKEENRVY